MRSDSIRPCSALPDTTVMNPALSQTLLIRAAERGGDLSTITAALMRLLAQTSAAEMQAAILEALQRGVPHPNAVRLAPTRRREQRGESPRVGIALPAHLQARDTTVQPHALETYDQLREKHDASSAED
jgi:hypothetical protein